MTYKEPTFTVEELAEKTSHELDDWEEQRRKREASIRDRLRVLNSLPPQLEVRSVGTHELFGSEGSVTIHLDGDANEVVQRMLHLIEELPPEPIEKISASCVWIQPEGYREPNHKHDYENARTSIIPICPVWARASHVASGSRTYLQFHWFTRVHEMLRDEMSGTYADGEDIILRVEAEVLRPHDWVKYKCTFGHIRGQSTVTIASEEFSHRFVEPVVTKVGGGSRQASGRMIHWEQGTQPSAVLRRSEAWKGI